MKKRFAVFGILVVLTLALAGAALAGPPPQQWDLSRDVSIDIIYDGYCDGVSGTLSSSTGVFTGVYSSSCATCPFPDAVVGAGGQLVAHGRAANWDYQNFDTFTVLRANGTWSHYDNFGNQYNAGTWTACSQAAPVSAGAPVSTAR